VGLKELYIILKYPQILTPCSPLRRSHHGYFTSPEPVAPPRCRPLHLSRSRPSPSRSAPKLHRWPPELASMADCTPFHRTTMPPSQTPSCRSREPRCSPIGSTITFGSRPRPSSSVNTCSELCRSGPSSPSFPLRANHHHNHPLLDSLHLSLVCCEYTCVWVCFGYILSVSLCVCVCVCSFFSLSLWCCVCVRNVYCACVDVCVGVALV